MTGVPSLTDVALAGVPATLARPARPGPWPALVFCNGVTARGRRHPDVQRLARALARTGHVVLVPDPPGLARGELSDDTVAALAAVTLVMATGPDSRGGRVGLLGVSAGTTLALLVAERPDVAEHISVVAGTAPLTDLANTVRLATTGRYRENGQLHAYPSGPFLRLIIARSLAAGLPPGPDRDLIVGTLAAVDDDAPDPLMPLRQLPREPTTPASRALLDLLLNTAPERFDGLYAALPEFMRAGVERLSPLAAADRLRAHVELASAPRDKYFPLAESRALAGAAPDVRLTVIPTLSHAGADVSLASLVDLARIDALGVRVLRRAAAV